MHNNNELIQKLEANGFIVRNDNAVIKYSNKTRRKERAGIINEKGVYFFATNVAPYNQGQNSTKDVLGESIEYVCTAPIKKKVEKVDEVKINFTFKDYSDATNRKSDFGDYLQNISNDYDIRYTNDYDIRGVRDGYMEYSTLFPYINYTDEFQTAKIVKYNAETGKRCKSRFSNNTFHKYKPILKYLKIEGSVSKSINCFFGEHLVSGNDKTIAIVESEKTAIILGMIYSDIVFIATGGATNLKRLDWDFLKGRNIIVYPDKGVQEWFEICAERDWDASTVLELSNEANEGDDLADHIKKGLWSEIDKELSEVSKENKSLLNQTELNFTAKNPKSKERCTPDFHSIRFIKYWDNSEGESFKGKAFAIFKNSFQVINAGIDFNALVYDDGVREPLWFEYQQRLMKCFAKTKYLNKKKDYIKAYKGFIQYLNAESNYTVNSSYVENYLIPYWDSIDFSFEDLQHTRNWILTEKILGSDDYAFIRELNEDRAIAKTYYLLCDLKPLINEYRFIDANALGLSKRRDNPFIWGLIESYNKDIVGCTNANQFKNLLEFEEYIEWINSTASELGGCYKWLQNLPILYSNTLSVGKKHNQFSEPSERLIHYNTKVSRELIKHFMSFTPDDNLHSDLQIMVYYLLTNKTEYKITRVKESNSKSKRLIIEPTKTVEEMKAYLEVEFSNEVTDKEAEALKDYELNGAHRKLCRSNESSPTKAFN